MIKIAICDDDVQSLGVVRNLLKKFESQEQSIVFSKGFTSSKDLLDLVLGGEIFDLFLLDVVMPDIDGISLGECISQNLPNAKIIYFSSSREFAVESYMVNAFYYMLKPIQEKMFFHVLKSAIDTVAVNNTKDVFIAVETASGTIALESGKIVYCVLENRRVKHIMSDGRSVESKIIRNSLAEHLADLLKGKKFAKCNAHCVVNLAQVKVINPTTIIMKDGVEINISRYEKKQLDKAYFDYYFGNFGGAVQ